MTSVLALSMTACATSGSGASEKSTEASTQATAQADLPEDPNINPDTAQYWRETLQNYRKDDNVKQILLVRYTGGCSANAFFYEKSEHNNAWELTLESDVYVGKHGIDKTGEGDAKTPTADFGVRRAFGILPNPGAKLDYLDVTENTYACDEDCEYYNQIIDSKETGHECTGEDMYTFTPEYNYGIETSFNDANHYPDGSAVFLHCKGAKAFTGGCVAFDQKDMEYIIKHAEKGMRVVIGPN
ncbi:MAG: hypothetical protein Q4E53_05250 [Eubacteriales bacterium]|nr:hypothetical protein [Eubacteriales bacterium]